MSNIVGVRVPPSAPSRKIGFEISKQRMLKCRFIRPARHRVVAHIDEPGSKMAMDEAAQFPFRPLADPRVHAVRDDDKAGELNADPRPRFHRIEPSAR